MDSLERTIKNGLNTVQYNQVEACLKVLKNDGKNKKGQKIAKLLAPILDDDDCILSNKIKNTICECLEIVAPEKAAEYLTRKTLKDETATTAAISKRLYDLRENLPKSADRFITQPSFLENAAGKKLLAWLLGQEEREARQIVRAQLATGRRGEKLAKAYGECFFLALKNYQNIIIDELQNWVRAALYSENEYVAQRAAVLFRSAVPDRRDDKRAFVDEASYAALAPLLWRSLRCANGKIRTRAILLLGIAFPVFSDDVDAAIEEQLKMISTMITDDPLPTARAAACRALAQVIHAFGALIPQSQLIHIAKNTLASTAARDISHFSVREAAILAIGEILPQLQNANASILDALAPCVHDVHPKCRAACLKALRAQSKLSGQQLPSRLLGMYRAAQNSKASKKLAASAAKVLLNCENESLAQRVRRALALAKNDLAATRVLYARHVVSIYGAPESAKLAVALVAAATAAYAGTLRKKKKKT
uniref:Sister chromatid cohesion protein n=1 Tax=Aureoumbra lagunensis TaxID=44058 RepID=A0A7S3NF31_9STRA